MFFWRIERRFSTGLVRGGTSDSGTEYKSSGNLISLRGKFQRIAPLGTPHAYQPLFFEPDSVFEHGIGSYSMPNRLQRFPQYGKRHSVGGAFQKKTKQSQTADLSHKFGYIH